MAGEAVKVQSDKLKKLMSDKLVAAGMLRKDADMVCDVLTFAELRGVSTHGAIRIEHYVNRIAAGGINIRPDMKVERLKSAVSRIDAQGGMGHLASIMATEEAIRLAGEHGVGMVGIRNNSHNGALAYYTQMALDRKLVAMVTDNVDNLVVPFGGRFAFLGTNPWSFGFPGRKENILLDMATSEIPWGKIISARMEGKRLKPGLAQDADGNPTTDPEKAASLTPFGGAKGYGVNIMTEALTGLLIGGVFGPHLHKMYGRLDLLRNLSTFVLVMDPSLFYGGGDGYLDVAQDLIDEIHAIPPAEGFDRVLIPGDIEAANEARLKVEGIPVPKPIYDYLIS